MAVRRGTPEPDIINFRPLTWSDDVGWGFGGDDLLTGGGGNDRLHGGIGDDRCYGDGGFDLLFGAIGDDRLFGGGGSDWLEGQDGADLLYGGLGIDFLLGGTNSDKLYGQGSSDLLLGEGGRDFLYGGAGLDILFGGHGRDMLSGGSDTDFFLIFRTGSEAERGRSDVIVDWNAQRDAIVSQVVGTADNYSEAATRVGSIVDASVEAQQSFAGELHVFLWNAASDIGYLLSDLDANSSFETGVVLKGAGSAADFDWTNIFV